jgi:hypothetical protein
VLKLSPDLREIETVYYPVGRAQQEDWAGGYAHINSILGLNGTIYLLKHNGRPEQACRTSEIIHCDERFSVLDTTELNGHACHNIVILEDGSLLSCGSHEGELIDGQRALAKIDDLYTRGLSVDDAQIVMGGSRFTIRAGPHGRRYVPGRVVFYDRKMRLQTELTLPAAPTDIRRIDGQDLGLSEYRQSLEPAQPSH